MIVNWYAVAESSCRWCRGVTPMTATEECDFCYELHWRIDRRPDLARAMLAKATPRGVLRKLLWIVNYVVVESFGEKHLDALVGIVGLFNDCGESERAILEFVERLFQKYRD